MGGTVIDTAVCYAAALGAFLARSDRAWASPVAVAIEPTAVCNLRCPLCAAGAGQLNRRTGHMSLSTFETIMVRLPRSIGTLYLWGQGEPFIAPDFRAMVSCASKRGIRTIVSTNGHFLDDAAALVGSGMTELIVSIDGITADVYESYRIGGDFNRVITGIRRVAAEKHSQGRGPVLTLQYLLTRETAGMMDEVRAFGRSLGADRVVFKTLQAAWLPGGEKMLPDDLRLTRYRRGPNGELVTDRSRLIGNRCLRLYYSLQIDWQGNVVPCCFDKNSEQVLGNLLEQEFDDIWNGERARAFRHAMNTHGRTCAMCADCSEGLKRLTINA